MKLLNEQPLIVVIILLIINGCQNPQRNIPESPRERISINEDWYFMKYRSPEEVDNLIYDVRPKVTDNRDDKPTEATEVEAIQELKRWILPTGNNFIKDATRRHVRPAGNPGEDFPFVQSDFDDSSWERLDLPHDWAIKGPFF